MSPSTPIIAEAWRWRPDQMVDYETYWADYQRVDDHNRALLRRQIYDQPPAPMPHLPTGVWLLDRYMLSYGRMLDYMAHVAPGDLIFREDPAVAIGRADHYARWFTQGHLSMPPIHVIAQDSGKWLLINGHARVIAATMVGLPFVPAWVSYGLDTGLRAHGDRKMISAPLTYEYVVLQAYRQGKPVPGDVLSGVIRSLPQRSELWRLFPEMQSASNDPETGCQLVWDDSAVRQAALL